MKDNKDSRPWLDILDFWFPEEGSDEVDFATHKDHWQWRMHGGADHEITRRYSKLAADAAKGRLDHWASDFEGRLALIIILDQFSRSVWRDSPRAYAQDTAALALTIQGLSNGHYAAQLTPWRKVVFGLPLGHCEGIDHIERINLLIKLREDIATQAPANLAPIYHSLIKQAHDVRKIVTAFGRHPHRNHLLDRLSTPDEEAYIANQQFPHLRAFQD